MNRKKALFLPPPITLHFLKRGMQNEHWRKAVFGCCATTEQRMAGAEGGGNKSMLKSFCIQLIEPTLRAPTCQLWSPYFTIKRKFKNKLWVTESDQIGRPRHQYGKSFLSSKLSMTLAAAPQAPLCHLAKRSLRGRSSRNSKKRLVQYVGPIDVMVTSAKPAQKHCSANASL